MPKTEFKKLIIDSQLGLTPQFINIDRLDLTKRNIILDIKEDEKQEKIKRYKAILESHGITKLSNLGNLTLTGNVVPESGLISVKSTIDMGELIHKNATLFQSAFSGIIK